MHGDLFYDIFSDFLRHLALANLFYGLSKQGLAEQGCLGVKNTKKRQINPQKNNPKRGGAKRRPFLDNFCVFICLFFVSLTPRHPCSASPCLLNPLKVLLKQVAKLPWWTLTGLFPVCSRTDTKLKLPYCTPELMRPLGDLTR